LLTVGVFVLMIRKFEFVIDLMGKDVEKLIKSREFKKLTEPMKDSVKLRHDISVIMKHKQIKLFLHMF
jgi:hypothetical protein